MKFIWKFPKKDFAPALTIPTLLISEVYSFFISVSDWLNEVELLCHWSAPRGLSPPDMTFNIQHNYIPSQALHYVIAVKKPRQQSMKRFTFSLKRNKKLKKILKKTFSSIKKFYLVAGWIWNVFNTMTQIALSTSDFNFWDVIVYVTF